MGAKFWIGVFNDYQLPILLFVVSLGFTAGWFGRDSNDPDYLPCYAPKEMGEDPKIYRVVAGEDFKADDWVNVSEIFERCAIYILV